MNLKIKNKVFFICSLAYFVANLDSTIVNVALPAISKQYSIDVVSTRNVLIVFSFAYGLSIPIGNYLADKIGIKKVFLSAALLFAASSILCALSQNITTLSIMRGLQGASAACFTPVARSIVIKYSENDKIINNMANILSLGLFAQTIGPFIGGLIIKYSSWKWIFFINIPLCITILIIGYQNLENLKEKDCNKFDLWSFINLTLVISFLLMTCEYITHKNINIYRLAALFLCFIIFMLLYIVYSQKNPLNIINNNLFKNRTFRNISIISLICRQGTGSLSFLFVLILASIYNLKADKIGNIILFYGLGIWLSKFIIPKLLSKFEPEAIIYNTLIGMFFLIYIFSFTLYLKSLIFFSILLFIIGMTLSLFFGCANGLTLKVVDKSNSNQASTILSLNMYISQSTSVSILNILISFGNIFSNVNSIQLLIAIVFLNLFILSSMVFMYITGQKHKCVKVV